jgi:hypothetical protein
MESNFHVMKTCPYCGRKNEDDAIRCSGCETAFAESDAASTDASKTVNRVKYEFVERKPAEMEKDFVTLVTCARQVEADIVVGHLETAGISAFVPDEFVSQTFGGGLSSLGYVRVQVSPKDYTAAREFLESLNLDSESPSASPG